MKCAAKCLCSHSRLKSGDDTRRAKRLLEVLGKFLRKGQNEFRVGMSGRFLTADHDRLAVSGISRRKHKYGTVSQ